MATTSTHGVPMTKITSNLNQLLKLHSCTPICLFPRNLRPTPLFSSSSSIVLEKFHHILRVSSQEEPWGFNCDVAVTLWTVVMGSTLCKQDLANAKGNLFPDPYEAGMLCATELPGELDEESKFVPLNAEDPSYGPPAILLLGFGTEEGDKIQQLLKELDGEFLDIIYCTEDMITRTLREAMNNKQQSFSQLKIAKSVPRMCFLSGLTGEEMMMFIDAYHDSGLEPAVFAAHVPNSSDKLVQELIEEVMGDHEMLAGKDSD